MHLVAFTLAVVIILLMAFVIYLLCRIDDLYIELYNYKRTSESMNKLYKEQKKTIKKLNKHIMKSDIRIHRIRERNKKL